MAEGEIESFCAVGAKAFLEFGGRLGFLMRDLGAELLVNLLQAFVRDGVPAAVVDRAGSEEADLHRRGGGRRRGGLVFRTGEEEQRESGERGKSFHGRDCIAPRRAATGVDLWYLLT